MKYADVAIAVPMRAAFTYAVPDEFCGRILSGYRVAVVFNRRPVVGFVLSLKSNPPVGLDPAKIRCVERVLDDEPVFSSAELEWLVWIASYYCASIGDVCRTALPARLNAISPPKTSRPVVPREIEHGLIERGQRGSAVVRVRLTSGQQAALHILEEEAHRAEPKPVLMHGVTGSGKTEVYIRLFEHMAREGKQAILLVPEIGLTPQLAGRIIERFGTRVALYHSSLTDAQRHGEWQRIRRGEADVVVGTRSALFAPCPRLGAIVVDEEHDPSYKQDEGVLYHARDAAVMRGRFERALVVMGSATPSIESYANAQSDKYRLVHLPERTGGGALPRIELIDMRRETAGGAGRVKGVERRSLARPLIEAIRDTLGRGEQAMIFLNRRGYAHFLICEECGHSFECPNCDISLAYHRHPPKLICHYCDYAIEPPVQCPSCMGIEIAPMGRGTERIESEIAELFPTARLARLDRDTIAKAATRTQIYKRMHDGSIDILVGTQMIAKGHDFPNVTLVGIVAADVALHLPDFRAGERTFQLTTQVAGRAGRTSHGARVLVQTFQPEHPSLACALTHDFNAFFEAESGHRAELGYPPFTRMANIRISAIDPETLAKKAHRLGNELRSLRKAHSITILGPAPAPLTKVRNRYRWQLLIKAKSAKILTTFLANAQPALIAATKEGLRITIDVDPISMM